MKGEWKGYYQYNSAAIQQRRGVDKTFFHIHIQSSENGRFSGTVEDDLSTKGMTGTGEIDGSVEGHHITFVKRMPVNSMIAKRGETVNMRGKHPPIYYSGLISEDGQSIQGKWKFKFGFTMVGLLPMPIIPISGKWYMERLK